MHKKECSLPELFLEVCLILSLCKICLMLKFLEEKREPPHCCCRRPTCEPVWIVTCTIAQKGLVLKISRGLLEVSKDGGQQVI
jgi:hypothetical protein